MIDPQADVDIRPMRPMGAEFTAGFIARVQARLQSLSVEKIAVLDLSKWNTVVDWQAVYDGGVRCVILRATRGDSYVDPDFYESCQAAHAVGLYVMAYHYFYSHQSGHAQAVHHWNTVQPMFAVLGYIPVMWNDVEDLSPSVSNAQRLNRVYAFLNEIRSRQGEPMRCGIYSSPGYANTYLSPAPAWIVEFLQWVAHWTPAAMPITPHDWNPVPDFWQYGIWDDYYWCAPVEGCEADIDRDWFFGTLEQLAELATGNEIIIEPPPIPPDPPEGDPLEQPPDPLCWVKVTNEIGVKLRRGAATNQSQVGSLAYEDVVPAFERLDKPNGEVWLHTREEGSQKTGWAAQFFPDYGDDAQLMEFVFPPEVEE